MSRETTEDRLRAALQARAEQVTQESLRPAVAPARSGRRRKPRPRPGRWTWMASAAAVAAASAAVVVGVSVVGDDSDSNVAGPLPSTSVTPTSAEATTIHTGSDCPREGELVTEALTSTRETADVDGDGRLDSVAVVADKGAADRCRAFVGVRTATGVYSTALDGTTTVPTGQSPEIVGFPDLGADGDAEIVVDTHARTDGQLAQLFTLTADGLRWVPAPAFEDGTFYVEGGGLTEPRGADCTAAGELVLSMGLVVDRGRVEVTRNVYTATGDPLQLGGPEVHSTTVPGDSLVDRFPEFGTSHFAACS